MRCLATYLSLLLLFTTCKKETAPDCFKSSGPDQTDTRYPGDFTAVQVTDKMDVRIVQGSEHKVEVTAGRYLLRKISSKVANGTLSLTNNNTCNFVRGYKKNIQVTVTLPYLGFAQNNGVGTLRIDNFQQDTLVVRAESSGDIHVNGQFNEVRTSSHGNGDVYVHGSTNRFFVYSNGTNYTHAEHLQVKSYLFVHLLSVGDCRVNATATEEFAFNIGSKGNIYYTGTPAVMKDVSERKAPGKIIRE